MSVTGRVARVATYNIHGGVGVDKRTDIDRIARVIAEIAPDVMALQEVAGAAFETLSESFGHHAVAGPAVIEPGRRFGNLLLSRWPITAWEVVDLAFPEREPRNAIFAEIAAPGGPLRVIATHFGLKHRERMAQARLLADLAAQHDAGPLVIAGDFNDWPPLSRAVNLVRRTMGLGFGAVPRLPTFPTRLPLLALDRVFVRPKTLVRRTWVHDSPLARRASDHRPLIAEIDLVASPPPPADGRPEARSRR